MADTTPPNAYIELLSPVWPAGDFGSHIDIFGKGGFVTLEDSIESNDTDVVFINNRVIFERRKKGMLVYINDNGRYYRCTNIGTQDSDGQWKREYFTGRYFYGATSPTASDIVMGERWFDTVVGTEYTYLPISDGSTHLAWIDTDHIGEGDRYVNIDGDVFTGTITGPFAAFTQGMTASSGFIGTLTGTNASFTSLTSSSGFIGTLTGINASFVNLTASNGFIGTLTGTNSSFVNLTASSGFIGNLTGTNASFTSLTSSSGFIGNLTGTNASFTNLTASNGFIGTLTGTNASFVNLTASNGFIGTLTGTNASFTSLTASSGFIGNLTAGTSFNFGPTSQALFQNSQITMTGSSSLLQINAATLSNPSWWDFVAGQVTGDDGYARNNFAVASISNPLIPSQVFSLGDFNVGLWSSASPDAGRSDALLNVHGRALKVTGPAQFLDNEYITKAFANPGSGVNYVILPWGNQKLQISFIASSISPVYSGSYTYQWNQQQTDPPVTIQIPNSGSYPHVLGIVASRRGVSLDSGAGIAALNYIVQNQSGVPTIVYRYSQPPGNLLPAGTQLIADFIVISASATAPNQ